MLSPDRMLCITLIFLMTIALTGSCKAHASPGALEANQIFTQCVKLLEELSSGGMNVSKQVELLNTAIRYIEANQTEKAQPLVVEAYTQLSQMSQELPSFKLAQNMQRGVLVSVLAAAPILFYYFFPRLYALIWLHNRRTYIVKYSKRERK